MTISQFASSQARDTAVKLNLQVFSHLMSDPTVTEIAVNGQGAIFYEKAATWHREENKAISLQSMMNLGKSIATFSTQKWDDTAPLLSASMPDGQRVQFVCPSAVEPGKVSMTMRIPDRHVRTLEEFSAAQLFSEVKLPSEEVSDAELALMDLLRERQYEQFFRQAVLSRMNIVVSGATGSGKTTFMKGLVQEIPRTERIITIEDVRELFLPHENAVHLLYSKGGQGVAKVTAKDLLQACLRMKPDRILLAELRGDECLYYVRNAASGHPGSITSCHAGSTALAFEQLALMIQDSPGGANLDFQMVKRLLTLTIDIVVQFQNHGGRRFISEIYFNPKAKRRVMYSDAKPVKAASLLAPTQPHCARCELVDTAPARASTGVSPLRNLLPA